MKNQPQSTFHGMDFLLSGCSRGTWELMETLYFFCGLRTSSCLCGICRPIASERAKCPVQLIPLNMLGCQNAKRPQRSHDAVSNDWSSVAIVCCAGGTCTKLAGEQGCWPPPLAAGLYCVCVVLRAAIRVRSFKPNFFEHGHRMV